MKYLNIVGKAFLGRFVENLITSPICLLYVLIFRSIWILKYTFESNTIPRRF